MSFCFANISDQILFPFWLLYLIAHITKGVINTIATWLINKHAPSFHGLSWCIWRLSMTIFGSVLTLGNWFWFHLEIWVIFECGTYMFAFDKEKTIDFTFGSLFYLLETCIHNKYIIDINMMNNMRNGWKNRM